jgi:hypothetical protein
MVMPLLTREFMTHQNDVLKAQAPYAKLTGSEAAWVHAVQRGKANERVRFGACKQAPQNSLLSKYHCYDKCYQLIH